MINRKISYRISRRNCKEHKLIVNLVIGMNDQQWIFLLFNGVLLSSLKLGGHQLNDYTILNLEIYTSFK